MTDIYDEKSKRLSFKDIKESNCMSAVDLEELEIKMMEIKLQSEVDEWYKNHRRNPKQRFFN